MVIFQFAMLVHQRVDGLFPEALQTLLTKRKHPDHLGHVPNILPTYPLVMTNVAIENGHL